MSTTTTLALAASSWAILMALGPLLQVREMVQRRSSEGISRPYFAVLVVGFVLWTAYGFAKSDLALIVPNILAAVVGTATIIIAWVLRPGGEHDRATDGDGEVEEPAPSRQGAGR